MSNSNAKFLTGAPMRHVAIMSATASIGLMAMFVVDFVDMIFISMLGNAALAAAIGYVGSIFFYYILWDRDCDCGRCLGCTCIGIR